MKKLVALTIAVTLGLASTSAIAAGIKDTKHDLSVGSANMTGSIAGGSNQICIYCHTPHNAVPSIPLWNRGAATNANFSFYSSPSMKLHQGAKTAFEATSTSLQCMSCHSGVDGLGALIANKGGEPAAALTGVNASGNVNGDVLVANGGANKALLGTSLTNDHPVNIQMVNGTAGLNSTSATNYIKGTALTNPLPLFKGTTGDNYIECGSCHAVHDNSHLKFLRTSNKGSVLCLACHAK